MSYRILIVEDEPIIADDIEATLEAQDYIVAGKAYSGVQALDMIVNRYPDLILLDIALKGDMDGIAIGELLHHRYRLPFIYITSYSDTLTLDKAKPTMPYGYIVKPFRDRDLLATIEMGMYRYVAENNRSVLDKEKLTEGLLSEITKMEYQIALQLWEGKTNKDIGSSLFISVNTVKTHIKNLFTKFDVRSRGEWMRLVRNKL